MENETETKTEKKLTLSSLKKPLLVAAGLGAVAAGAVVFAKATESKKIKIGWKEIVEQQLGLAVDQNEDLVFVNRNGQVLYVVQYLEASDGGQPKEIDWRTIEEFDLCQSHQDCFVMIAGGKERHALYFVCLKPEDNKRELTSDVLWLK